MKWIQILLTSTIRHYSYRVIHFQFLIHVWALLTLFVLYDVSVSKLRRSLSFIWQPSLDKKQWRLHLALSAKEYLCKCRTISKICNIYINKKHLNKIYLARYFILDLKTCLFKPCFPYVPFWFPWQHQKMFSGGSKGNIESKWVNMPVQISSVNW